MLLSKNDKSLERLTDWDYFTPFSLLQREWPVSGNYGWSPHIDVGEAEDAFKVWAELPGMEKEDIGVEYRDGVLSISGEKKSGSSGSGEGEKSCCSERRYGRFIRTVRFEEGSIDADNIKASYKNGLLELTVPKSKKVRTKRISVDQAD